MSDNNNDLFSIGNFLVLVVSGAVIPLLLVLYKSRCSSICWGCIKRDVLPPDKIDPKDIDEEHKAINKENNIVNNKDGEKGNNKQDEIQS